MCRYWWCLKCCGFDYYDEQSTLSGSKFLAGVDSLLQVAGQKGETLWDSDSIHIGTVKALQGKSAQTVSEGDWRA